MRNIVLLAGLLMISAVGVDSKAAESGDSSEGWRSLPLIEDGKIAPDWVHMGYGSFAVVDGSLRTECDEKGLGLLLYRGEKFGTCQIRVVYRAKDANSNSGVYVRIDDGILDQIDKNHPPARRDAEGNLTDESLKIFMEASEQEIGPWYAVHHGYELQIRDKEGPFNRTGAIYSLSVSVALPDTPPDEWRTMIITLDGNQIKVHIDGKWITTFDPEDENVPTERQWYEPRREPRRPEIGYIGLQNHDPGDVVYFKEVSVRPLEDAK